MVEDQLLLNGIDGVTGGYLVEPLSAREATRLADADADSATETAAPQAVVSWGTPRPQGPRSWK